MKTRIKALVLPALLIAAAPVHAQEDPASWFSGNVSVLSDYSLRGISQTSKNAALQGGIDFGHPSGFYLGTWGSSLDWATGLELDAYGGYAFGVGPASVDAGVIYYGYPGADSDANYDFIELSLGASGSVGAVGAGVSAKYSPEFFAATGAALYLSGSLDVPVSSLTLSGAVGYQTIDDNETWGTPDYMDWLIGASFSWSALTAAVQLVGTNLEEADCFGGATVCETRAVLSLSWSN